MSARANTPQRANISQALLADDAAYQIAFIPIRSGEGRMNQIARNRSKIGERHYVLAASLHNRFFNLWPTKIRNYERLNPDFRIVLYIDEKNSDKDDFYSIPYSVIRHLLKNETLDRTKGKRWTGTIIGSRLSISNSGGKVDVSSFRNNYTNLGIEDSRQTIDSEGELDILPSKRQIFFPQPVKRATVDPPAEEDLDTHSGHTQLLREISDRTQKSGAFDLGSIGDARELVLTSIVYRRGQPKFRRDLLIAYNYACPITGCSVQEVLEAAHIFPYRGDSTNDVRNGLLLRSDIHLLFDIFLLAVEPLSHSVRVSSALRGTEYERLDGIQASLPKSSSFAPRTDALQWRIERLKR